MTNQLVSLAEEASVEEMILILISSILLQKRNLRKNLNKGAQLTYWYLSKFSQSVEEKSRVKYAVLAALRACL